jgi:hypothetical protein
MKQPAHIRPCMPKTHPRHMGWHQCRQIIFHWSSGYDRYMIGIYMSYVCISLSSTLGGLPGLTGALCRCTPAPWPLADLLCISNRETGNMRRGLSKVPQPGVGLIHMAASEQLVLPSANLGLLILPMKYLIDLDYLTYDRLTDQLSMLS